MRVLRYGVNYNDRQVWWTPSHSAGLLKGNNMPYPDNRQQTYALDAQKRSATALAIPTVTTKS
jgi:hypothetical protein